MTHADRGTKHRCPNCGAAYYDLGRSPIICPKCQTLFVETPRVPVRAGGRARVEPPVPLAEPADETTPFEEDEALEGEDLDAEIVSDEDQDDEAGTDRD